MVELTKIFEQVSKIQIKSITDPLLKYATIMIVLGCICASLKTDNWVLLTIFSLGVLLLVVAIVFYIYFSIKNPDYLRSETFQLQKQSIEMLGDKENSLNPNVREIKYIASPFGAEKGNNTNTLGNK